MIAPNQIILAPINTEKALLQRTVSKYHFWVSTKATKGQIRQAFYSLFSVLPLKINTIKLKGKSKTNWKSRKSYRKINRKKAIISLNPKDK
ncbi:50S ribosomal protein L23, partial [Candidatus Shapirobacteria bacterium]